MEQKNKIYLTIIIVVGLIIAGSAVFAWQSGWFSSSANLISSGTVTPTTVPTGNLTVIVKCGSVVPSDTNYRAIVSLSQPWDLANAKDAHGQTDAEILFNKLKPSSGWAEAYCRFSDYGTKKDVIYYGRSGTFIVEPGKTTTTSITPEYLGQPRP